MDSIVGLDSSRNEMISNDKENNDMVIPSPVGLIVSTSRYKFPRKNSSRQVSSSSSSTSSSDGSYNLAVPTQPPPAPPPPPPPSNQTPPPLPPTYPNSISPAKTCTIDGMKPSLILIFVMMFFLCVVLMFYF